jgi:Mn2+/Fe2+ NRAMP family transporter
MGFIVIFMGITFITTAIFIKPPFMEVLQGSFIPNIPNEPAAGLLVLGLVGTTVVPYDLFLGSGVLDKKQTIGEMRFGISIAIILGGIISMSILIVGTIVEGELSFVTLAKALTQKVDSWAVPVFAFGMFAAGFSSAITAPLAASITAKSLFEKENSTKWKTQSTYYKLVWFSILVVGLFFGYLEVKPIPAIILAQALNGLILPFISIFLIFVINDPKLMGKNGVNGWISNFIMAIIVWITMILGFSNILNAVSNATSISDYAQFASIEIVSVLSLLLSISIFVSVYKMRKRSEMNI